MSMKKIYLYDQVTIDSLMATALLRVYLPQGENMAIQLANALPENATEESLNTDGVMAISFPIGAYPHMVQDKRLVLLTERIANALPMTPYMSETIKKIVYHEMFGKRGVEQNLRATDPQSTALNSLLMTLKSQTKLAPEKIVNLFLPLVEEYIRAEMKKEEKFSVEYKNAYSQGRVEGVAVHQGKRLLRCVIIKSGYDGLAGWLFSNPEIGADVITQILPRGYVLIMAKPGRDVKLLDVVSVLRIEEARSKRYPFDKIDRKLLTSTGRVEGVEEWYYNSQVNSINNGGFRDKRTKPTNLSLLQIKHALTIGLNFSALAQECPRQSCTYKKCSFYPYNFFRCHKIRKYGGNALVGIATSGAEEVVQSEPEPDAKQ